MEIEGQQPGTRHARTSRTIQAAHLPLGQSSICTFASLFYIV